MMDAFYMVMILLAGLVALLLLSGGKSEKETPHDEHEKRNERTKIYSVAKHTDHTAKEGVE